MQEWVKDPDWRAANLPVQDVGSPAQAAVLVWWRERSWAIFAGAIALVVLARGLRTLCERRWGLIRLRLPSGRIVAGPQGLSVLQIIQLNNVPHSSACGGRGRCTTCRVRIAAHLPAFRHPGRTSRLHWSGSAPEQTCGSLANCGRRTA